LIAVDWKIDTLSTHAPRVTPPNHSAFPFARLPSVLYVQSTLTSKLKNKTKQKHTKTLHESKLRYLTEWGQEDGLSWEDEGKLRNCCVTQPVNYCSFPACVRRNANNFNSDCFPSSFCPPAIYCEHSREESVSEAGIKTPSMLCLSFWYCMVRVGQGWY
jgi:hypothetical protein